MDKAKANGVELEYEAKGSGEPVLLISTGPIADSFLPFLSQKALVERYRLISYHQRGQAGSTPSLGQSASPSMRPTPLRCSTTWASVVPTWPVTRQERPLPSNWPSTVPRSLAPWPFSSHR